MMENMGLRVISEHPYRIELDGQVAYIQDFEVESANRRARRRRRLDQNFEEAFAQIWRGNAENDGFNRLILAAGLSWRQVAMLRAYSKYLQQVGVPFSQAYVEQTLARYPLLARLLVELFEARFDPSTGSESKAEIKQGMQRVRARTGRAVRRRCGAHATLLEPVVEARAGGRERQVEITRSVLLGLMDRVSSLDEDRILRSFIGVIDATLRTSYYFQRKDGCASTAARRLHQLQARFARRCPTCPSRVRTARSGCAARASKACTCASARSRAAACAGRIGARISAPRCWAWSRRRW